MTKFVYSFGRGKAEGSSLMRNLLGGKGCELAEMTNLGISVPPGFTITTQAWAHYNRAGHQWPEGLWEQILENLARLEQDAGLTLGDAQRPLLVSVRSGARVSMPGMMETVLNLGLNDATVDGLAAWTRQRAVRVGLLPALHHDVRQRGARDQARGVRRAARCASRVDSAWPAIPRYRPPSCASSSRPSRISSPPAPAIRSRKIRASSCAWPSTPSSTRGSPRRRWSTGGSTPSPPSGARR